MAFAGALAFVRVFGGTETFFDLLSQRFFCKEFYELTAQR